jgi:hypothetical protein
MADVAGNPRFNPQREHDVPGGRRVDGRAERLSERERANQHDVRGRRRVDGKPERGERSGDRESKRREDFHLPALIVSNLSLFFRNC